MKKFLMYCLIIVVALFVGFTTYYFIATDEEFKLAVAETETICLNVGDRFEISDVVEYNKDNIKDNIDVVVSNETVLSYNKETGVFLAEHVGTSNITLTPNNKKFGPYVLIVKVGDGSSSDSPIYISTATQLNSIGQTGSNWTLDKNYELVADIYLSDVVFIPIGNGVESGFTGTFNGANHTIYNLTINSNAGIQYAGLFAKIGVSGIVKNVKVSDANISGAFDSVGVIAGINNGTIILCDINNATISNNTSNSYTGGLVGRNQYTITNVGSGNGVRANIALCQVINLSLNTQSLYNGGLVGENFASNIQNSCAVISGVVVQNNSYFGGLIGDNSSYRSQSGNSAIYRNASVQYCHAIVNGYGSLNSSYHAGFIGLLRDNNSDNPSKNNNTFARNYYVCNGLSAIGGISGTAQRDISADKISGKNYEDMKLKETYINWDFTNYWILEGDYATINFGAIYTGGNNGNVDDDTNFEPEIPDDSEDINEENGLLAIFEEMRNNPSSDKSYTITKSMILDLEGQTWVPIGTATRPFYGSLFVQDGVEVIVKNFKILDYQYAGFFGNIGSGAVIKGLNLQNVWIDNDYSSSSTCATGALCGYVSSGARILDCSVSGVNISAGNAIGGAVGINNGTLKNIQVSSGIGGSTSGLVINNTLTATKYSSEIGGIVGKNNATLGSSTVKGLKLIINNDNQAFVGGVVGGNYGSLQNSSASTVDINENSATMIYAGGISGYNNKTVSLSTAYKVNITLNTVNTSSRAGGISAYNSASGELKTSTWTNGNILAYAVGGACADNYGKITEISVGDESLGLGVIKGVHVAGLVYTNHENASCVNNLTISVIGSISNDGSASGVAYTMKNTSIITQTACGVQFNSVNSRENDFAESTCRFKAITLNTPININNWLGERFGIMEKCVIADRGAYVQSGEYLLDEIGIFQNKYAMIYKPEEAMGSKNYTCYTDNGFSESIWNFNYAGNHFPTLKNSPQIYV